MIQLKNVKKTYSNGQLETEALKGISIKIENGEYVSVVGTSGSGKSTLLNMIGGMDTLTSGEYYYNDIPVHKLRGNALHAFRKQHVSFVFQHFSLMNHYSVYENVEIPLLAKGVPKKQRRKMIMEQLDKLGIADLEKKMPIHISGGQQQRCAIARALVSGNEIILADEPTGALDKGTGLNIMQILKACCQGDKILIVVTHDEHIAAMSDRIIRLEDGMVL